MNFNNFNVSDEQKENVQNVVNRYKGKSEDAIMSDIVKIAADQKKAGKLSDKDLDNFASAAAMMMSPDQKAKLMTIINSLKSQP